MALARRLRQETAISLRWIAENLYMGTWRLPPVISLVNRLLLLCDISRYSLLRFGVVPNCEIGNVKVGREVLPLCFKLEVVHFYKEHAPLILRRQLAFPARHP